MAGDTSTEAPEAATDLLEDAGAGAPGAEGASPETKGADAANSESKPAAKAGEDGAKPETADLLADDEEGKTTPEKADGPADAKKDGAAPETYEAFTLPEGVAIDEATLAKATPIFRDTGLSQDQAQKLVSLYADMQQAAAETQLAGFVKVKQDWAAEIKADKEFGGEAFSRTLNSAKAVLTKYGDATLRADLKEWGWANHPGLIKLLARVKADLSEDTTVNADAASQSAPKRPEEVMWPSMFQSKE